MIMLSQKAYTMIRTAVEHDKGNEVGGFGLVQPTLKRGEFYVTDIFVPPQEVTSSSVDITPDDLVKMIGEMAASGRTLNDWRFWWHSHARMGQVSPSGTDDKMLVQLAQELGMTNSWNGWFLGMVTNVKEDVHGMLQLTYPDEIRIKYEVSVEAPAVNARHVKTIEEQMKSVTKRTYPVSVAGGHQGQHSFMGNAAPSQSGRDREAKLKRDARRRAESHKGGLFGDPNDAEDLWMEGLLGVDFQLHFDLGRGGNVKGPDRETQKLILQSARIGRLMRKAQAA